ncbi:insulin-like growth factor-binding protein 6b [Boleophthalmus pectinirostris]|uniref:insulin-like growth factor-binding protein 6b n=1 Tax=Boleophthalmus pectinirostris TaxID=150288 RepID=UPI000A1C727B|nr:insulin-like growth factor-binding protein 6b [Boleophthalmus pectinirostris]XP_055022462.1 insulin-like growth factor-binding protein 6b [Boleophthalmus pectinirostris]
MPLSHISAAVLLLIAHCGAWTGASRLGPFKLCPSCRDPLSSGRPTREHQSAGSTTALALGEPCGVYTLSCARGLRCVPPPRDHSPLQALLQGRGVCAKGSRTAPTDKPNPAGPHPSHGGDLDKAPCRRLLNSVLRGLELTLFQSDRDIYIPNCDTRGFYRRKQCRSSKGMQRGHCWCVDELGTPLPSRAPEEGALSCDAE